MKKTAIVSISSLVFLLMASAVAVLSKWLFGNAVTALIIGVSILAVSAALALLVRESREVNIVCFIISSVAMGILMRAWYINRGFDNGFGVMAIVSLAAVLYLGLFFALSRLALVRNSKKAYVALAVIYLIISAAIYTVVVFTTETTYVSTFGYYMIIELAFIFAYSNETATTDELIRNLTLSTYSVFGAAIAIAVFIIIAAAGGDCDCDLDCDCDCFDCGDCFDGISERKKKKNKK